MAGEAVVRCPACSRKIKFHPEHAGKKMRCSCGAVVRMPADPSKPLELIAKAPAAPAGTPPAAKPAPAPAPKAPPAPAATGSNQSPIVPTGQSYELDDSMFNHPAPAPTPAAGETKCPKCNGKVKVGAVLCVNCGYNFKTGKKTTTTIHRDK